MMNNQSQFESLPSSGLVDEVFSIWFQTDFSPLLFKMRFIQRLRRPFRDWKGRTLYYSWCNPEQKQSRGPGISPAPLPKGDPDNILSLLSRSLKRSLPESQDSPTAAHHSRGPVESSPGSNLVQEINKRNGIKALFCFFHQHPLNVWLLGPVWSLTWSSVVAFNFYTPGCFSINGAKTVQVQFVCSIFKYAVLKHSA